ncbi:MAG: hypothetical protein ACHREM_21235 [Polyangiales bacterium]
MSVPPPRPLPFLALALAVGAALVTSVACTPEPDDPAAAPKTAPVKPKLNPPKECEGKNDPVLTAPYLDDFDRADLGADWRQTSFGAYTIKSGSVCTAKPKNHPLWLKKKLPANVRVEFDAKALTAEIDIKAELFGDGCAFDEAGRDYTATSYVAVLGAHKNTEDWLVRQFEHGKDARKTTLSPTGETIATSKVQANHSYHFELSRTDGREVRFVVDGVVVHAFDDPAPLVGLGHDHFAFNGWEAAVCFDKLAITPLP